MKLAIATIHSDRKFTFHDVERLRGYVGNTYKQEILFHNHLDEMSFLYQSSKIQYKLIQNHLTILGIEEGADLLVKHLYEMTSITLLNDVIPIEIELTVKNINLSVGTKFYRYKFLREWMALNEENYMKYREGKFDLNTQLQNNLIEFFKMCNTQATERIRVSGKFQEIPIRKRDTTVLGFLGARETNVKLPNFVGLGKRKSVGYGTIQRIE